MFGGRRVASPRAQMKTPAMTAGVLFKCWKG
jgi:hypothetical protein